MEKKEYASVGVGAYCIRPFAPPAFHGLYCQGKQKSKNRLANVPITMLMYSHLGRLASRVVRT